MNNTELPKEKNFDRVLNYLSDFYAYPIKAEHIAGFLEMPQEEINRILKSHPVFILKPEGKWLTDEHILETMNYKRDHRERNMAWERVETTMTECKQHCKNIGDILEDTAEQIDLIQQRNKHIDSTEDDISIVKEK